MKKIKIVIVLLIFTMSLLIFQKITKVKADDNNIVSVKYFIEGYEEKNESYEFEDELSIEYRPLTDSDNITLKDLSKNKELAYINYKENPNHESYFYLSFEKPVTLTVNRTYYTMTNMIIKLDKANNTAVIKGDGYEITTSSDYSVKVKTKLKDEPAPPVFIPDQVTDAIEKYHLAGIGLALLLTGLVVVFVRKRNR